MWLQVARVASSSEPAFAVLSGDSLLSSQLRLQPEWARFGSRL